MKIKKYLNPVECFAPRDEIIEIADNLALGKNVSAVFDKDVATITLVEPTPQDIVNATYLLSQVMQPEQPITEVEGTTITITALEDAFNSDLVKLH